MKLDGPVTGGDVAISAESVSDTREACDSATGDRDGILRWVLRCAAVCCLGGWTWVHYYWDSPYVGLLWSPHAYDMAAELGVEWDAFVGTGTGDGLVRRIVGKAVWLFAGLTVLAATVGSSRVGPAGRLMGRSLFVQVCVLIGVAGGMMLVLAYAKYVDSLRQLPMLVEHGGQILAPVLLGLAVSFGPRHGVTRFTAMVSVATTFLGHGSYALGLWPTPPTYIAMSSVILGTDADTSLGLVRAAGAVDLIVCTAILVPQVRRVAVGYAAVWGFLTAAARPVAGMSWELIYWGGDQYLHEFVLRAPHFLTPLYLYLVWGFDAEAARSAPSPPASIKRVSRGNE